MKLGTRAVGESGQWSYADAADCTGPPELAIESLDDARLMRSRLERLGDREQTRPHHALRPGWRGAKDVQGNRRQAGSDPRMGSKNRAESHSQTPRRRNLEAKRALAAQKKSRTASLRPAMASLCRRTTRNQQGSTWFLAGQLDRFRLRYQHRRWERSESGRASSPETQARTPGITAQQPPMRRPLNPPEPRPNPSLPPRASVQKRLLTPQPKTPSLHTRRATQ